MLSPGVVADLPGAPEGWPTPPECARPRAQRRAKGLPTDTDSKHTRRGHWPRHPPGWVLISRVLTLGNTPTNRILVAQVLNEAAK
jgi:hypothetical protein